MKLRASIVGLIVVAGAAVLTQPAGAAGDDKRKCGLLPGEGAYSYVEVKNVSCRQGKKVALRSYRKFCRERDCSTDPAGGFIKGEVETKGWDCTVKMAYEFSQARCAKGDGRILHRSGA